jgi:CDGSH-type Zn-finger protein
MDPIVAQKSPIVKEMAAGTYHWCACGKSKSQPLCDGSHKGSGFAPLPVTLAEPKKVAWCACKHSKNPPYCDGTHRTV